MDAMLMLPTHTRTQSTGMTKGTKMSSSKRLMDISPVSSQQTHRSSSEYVLFEI